MLNVLGVELDFDITSPADMLRYKRAGEFMETESEKSTLPEISPDDPGFIDAYIEMLNIELRLFGNFIDAVFGDGVAMQLLGPNPSLSRITEINDALHDATEQQGKDFGVKLQKYRPNRATRRARQ